MDDGSVVILLDQYEQSCMQCTEEPTLTRAPITPREVRRKYSKGRVLEVVFKKGYRKSGIWAAAPVSERSDTRNSDRWQSKAEQKRTVKEQLTGFRMGSYTLQESESVADAIRYMSSEIRRG